MTPTEHELTAATDTLARSIYADRCEAVALAGVESPRWDDLHPVQQLGIREHALTWVTVVLQALPDRAATERERLAARYRAMAADHFAAHGPHDPRGAALWDVANDLIEKNGGDGS